MYEKLYEENKGAIWETARRYRGFCRKDHAVSIEDLAQMAFIGLVTAANTFQSEKHKGWSSYSRWCMIHEIYKALGIRDGKLIKPHSSAVSLDKPLLDGDADSATLGDMLIDDSLPASDDEILREETRRIVRGGIEALTDPRQRRIVELKDIEGKTLDEAACNIGVNTDYAKQIYCRALSNLRRDAGILSLDDRTRFHDHKGVKAFLSDRTSVTEAAAIWRIDHRERNHNVRR